MGRVREIAQPFDKSLRTCTRCGKTKTVKDGFYRCKLGSMNDRTYGCAMPCIECNRVRCRGRPRSDAQRARDSQRAKRDDVREQNRLRSSAWYATDDGKAWMRQYGAKRYADRGDEIRASNRQRYHAQPELRQRIADDNRARRATAEGRAAHNASNSKYKTSERGRLLSRMHAQLRRARIASTVCTLTDTQWLAMVDAYQGRCAYCDTQSKLTIDHIEPLARGGAHAVANVAPACKRCNLKKGARPLGDVLARLECPRVEFLKRRGLALFRMVTREA